MFADDAKAYCQIKSVEDARGLQQDLNFLSSIINVVKKLAHGVQWYEM